MSKVKNAQIHRAQVICQWRRQSHKCSDATMQQCNIVQESSGIFSDHTKCKTEDNVCMSKVKNEKDFRLPLWLQYKYITALFWQLLLLGKRRDRPDLL